MARTYSQCLSNIFSVTARMLLNKTRSALAIDTDHERVMSRVPLEVDSRFFETTRDNHLIVAMLTWSAPTSHPLPLVPTGSPPRRTAPQRTPYYRATRRCKIPLEEEGRRPQAHLHNPTPAKRPNISSARPFVW